MTVVQELQNAQSFFNYFDSIKVALYSYTVNTNKIENFYITDSMEEVFGCPRAGFNINAWRKAIHPLDKNRVYRWKKQQHLKMEPGFIQYRIVHSDGSIHWLEDHLTPKGIKEDIAEIFLGILIDITAKKEYEQEIEYMAFYDTLTGLPNRNMLASYTPKAIARCKRKNTGLAVMYVDLDKFKNVNDTFGHEIGDILLKQVAQRLTECVRFGDIVSRQGGDEFVIVLEDTDLKRIHDIADRILKRISEPFIIEDKKINISASIGISLYPQDGEDLDTLVRHADQAMFECKASSEYQFYKTP